MPSLRECFNLLKLFFLPGKLARDVEIEIVALLAHHGEMDGFNIREHLHEGVDLCDLKKYTYVSLGLMYEILSELEQTGVIKSRMTYSDGRVRDFWRLTGKGPRDVVTYRKIPRMVYVGA